MKLLALILVLVLAGCAGDAPPIDVDAATWELLTSTLEQELKATSALAGPHLPADEFITVDDLTVTPLADGYLLEWSYKNPGDYNQDGEVNFGDLAVLGRHLNQDESGPEWNLASRADGNGDRVITLADITALASNWRGAVSGYVVAPELGDGDRNGWIDINDLTEIGYMLGGRPPFTENHHAVAIGAPMLGGQGNGDFGQNVTPGSPGEPGPWGSNQLVPSNSGVREEDGRIRLNFTLGGHWELLDFTVVVVPALDDGFRPEANPERIDLESDQLGPLSNLVTLPGWS